MEVSGFQPSSKELLDQAMEDLRKMAHNDPTRSSEIALLVEALAKAQGEIKSPERNRTVNVTTRDQSKSYTFKYATLDHIIDVIRAPLTKNGLWFTQIMKEDQGTFILDTRLMHASGQWIATQVPLIWDGNGGNQQFGSALTFMRRYALTSLLGIAAEEDDDANAADGNTINQAQDRKPISPKPDVMQEIRGDEPTQVLFNNPEPLVVHMNQDESASDWVRFGKELMEAIKSSNTSALAEDWRTTNGSALAEMESKAPKLHANLSAAMTKAINELKKAEKK